MKYLFIFTFMIIVKFAEAGEVQYVSTASSTLDCTLVKAFKSLVDSNKKTITLLEKKISESTSEEETQKWKQLLEDAKGRFAYSIESYKNEYNNFISLKFHFIGEGNYKIAYPKQESLESLTLQNYELINLCPQFIFENDDATLTTQIPGSCALPVNLALGFMCKHPYGQESDQLSEKVVQKIAEDFFVIQP